MLFYLIVAIFTTCAYFFAENSKKRLTFCFSFIIFLLIPSLVEGLRDWNVGEDMYTYGRTYFIEAQQYNSLVKYISELDDKEYGYRILNYLASRLGNINIFLFLCAFIKILLVGLTALHFKKSGSMVLFILSYMLIFYWYGFSLMRQSLSLCVSLYSFIYLFEKKYVYFAFLVVIAYLFHNSGVFLIMLAGIPLLSNFQKKNWIFLISILIVYLSSVTLFSFIAASGLFAERMASQYLDSGVSTAKANLLLVLWFILTPYFIKSQYKELKFVHYYSSFLTLLFLSLANMFEVAFRVSFYPMLLALITEPTLLNLCKNGTRKKLAQIIYILLLGAFIYAQSNHDNMAGVIPYKSSIIGI